MECSNCIQECEVNAECDFKCSDEGRPESLGRECRQICERGAICRMACDAGGCRQVCRSGATCEISCDGGGCLQKCEADTDGCETSCSGGSCVSESGMIPLFD